MKIKYVKDDLFNFVNYGCVHLAHGCNSKGKMGKGIALEIKNRFNFAYLDYVKSDRELGTVVRSHSLSCVIYNCITQQNYGNNPNIQYVSYEAIEKCVDFISKDLEWHQNPDLVRVAMPKIGSSLGGGDWNIISEIIEKSSKSFTPLVFTIKE